MKRLFTLSFILLLTMMAVAQTQQGVVKTRGRMVNGMLRPGKGLASATVKIAGRQAVVSQGKEGRFSFPVSGQKFRIESVQKKDYQLVDMSVCTEHEYSKNPLRLIMEKTEQLQSDLLASERNIRRILLQQLQKREDEIEALKVSQQEKDSLLRILYQQQTNNEKLIADMAKRFATIDYDQLDGFYQQVSWFIENGELTRADSLLRTRGDVQEQIKAQLHRGEVIKQRKQQIEKAEAVYAEENDELARRCFARFEFFQQQHLVDSAAYYLELRSSLDTTNIQWLKETADYLKTFIGDYRKAMDYYQNVHCQVLQSYGPNSSWVSESYFDLGLCYTCLGNLNQGLECLLEALSINETLYGQEHPTVADIYNQIGFFYGMQSKHNQSIEYFHKALDIYEKVRGKYHIDIARSYDYIGSAIAGQSKITANPNGYANALEYLQKALVIKEYLLGEEHLDVARSYDDIGDVLIYQEKYSQAFEYYKKALAIKEKVQGEENLDIAHSYDNIGYVYEKQGNAFRPLEYYQKALKIREKLLGMSHTEIANSYNNIGNIYEKQRLFSLSLEYHQKALDIQEKVFGKDNFIVAWTYYYLARVYRVGYHDYQRALDCCLQALAIQENILEKDHQFLAETYGTIGIIYYDTNNYPQAIIFFKKSLEIYEKAYGSEHPQTQKIKETIISMERYMNIMEP